MFLLFSMIKNSLKNRVLFLFFKYLSNLFLLLVYSGGNLDSLKNLHRLAYHWSTCRQWFFLSTGCISLSIIFDFILYPPLLYNNGPDFPGSNNRALFSLLAWHWLTIRRDFPIDGINIGAFPKGTSLCMKQIRRKLICRTTFLY